ncbi:hypothetical protein ACHAWF_000641, partial [Thalassiosira exigua]
KYEFAISDAGGDGLGSEGRGGYYVAADGVALGASSFFFHEERMTFDLPYDAELRQGDRADDNRATTCTDDFFLAVKTDDRPDETTWEVVDAATEKAVLTGGPYEEAGAVYTSRACLRDGEFVFRVRDAGGDGMCCGEGRGFLVASSRGETVLDSNGKFGEEASAAFEVGHGRR